MPAKRRILPEMCPKCRKKNGTVQFAILDDQIRFRIGHYDPKNYDKAKKDFNRKKIENRLEDEKKEKRRLRSSGRKWCDFRIKYLRHTDDLVEKGIVKNIEPKQGKTITLSRNQNFDELIKKRGWQAIPSSSKNAGRKNKNNEITVDQQKYSTRYEERNSKVIELGDEIIDTFNIIIKKLKTKPFESKLTEEERKDFTEFNQFYMKIIEALCKKKNLNFEEHSLLVAITAEMIKYFSFLYLAKVKKLHLSRKQAKKIRTGRVRNVLPLFDPRNRDDAIAQNFYGLQCKECDSWRVDRKESLGHKDLLHCYACTNEFLGKTVSQCKYCFFPFYAEVLQIIKNNGSKCPKCEKDIRIPISLMN